MTAFLTWAPIVAVPMALAAALASPTQAADAPLFENNRITMTVSNTPGGGMDGAARAVAQLLTQNLPGNPTVVLENRPGGAHVVGNNWFVAKAKRDGTDILYTSSSIIAQANRGDPQVQFNLQEYEYVGSIKYAESIVMVRPDAEKKINDAKNPAVVGTIPTASSTHVAVTVMAMRYLGHQYRYVVGYPGGNEMSLALQKGEIDVYGTKNQIEINNLVPSTAKVYLQSGKIRRSDYKDVPTIWELIEKKNPPAIDIQAFTFWLASEPLDHIVALPPGTDPQKVALIREAYAKASKDPEFVRRVAAAMGDQMRPISGPETKELIVAATAASPEDKAHMLTIRSQYGLPKGE
jgi:tripartite-type tricarboxylate transporter receptor subunit TctC